MKTKIVLHDVYCDVTYPEYLLVRNRNNKNPVTVAFYMCRPSLLTAFWIITIEAGMSQLHHGPRAKQCTGSHTYTTTHRNKSRPRTGRCPCPIGDLDGDPSPRSAPPNVKSWIAPDIYTFIPMPP
jgi:hypothetical protein